MVAPDSGQAVVEHAPRATAGLYPISLAVSDYDRTRPIVDGRVKPAGIALTASTAPISEFCRQPVYEQYDVAEMSFSWYLMARDRGEPVIALPIFPLRMAVWAYAYVRADSPIVRPSDLIGKTVGMERFRFTVHIWLRGLFKEHYGLAPEQVSWITAAPEGAGYAIPKHLRHEMRKGTTEGTTAEEHLKNGVVDAIYCTMQPKPFLDGEPWIRRLFPDAQAEMQSFVRRTGILPITHTVVMNRQLAEREPWIAKSIYGLFVAAQREADELCQTDPKMLSLADAVFIREQQQKVYGADPYINGVAPNRGTVEAFVRYAHEQGYISRTIPLEELFVPETLSL
jgi:4,5-dihydroxyphthalate decarboxylase